MSAFSHYFEKFNNDSYVIEINPGKYITYDVIKFWERVILTDKLKKNKHFLKSISISPDTRPDELSKELYDDYNYHWIFFLTNTWLNNFYHDWPMNNATLEKYLKRKFPGYAILLQEALGTELKPGSTVLNPLTNTSVIIDHINYEFNYIVVRSRNNFNAVNDLYSITNKNYNIKEFVPEHQAPIEICEKETDLRANFTLYDDVKNAIEPDYKIVTNETPIIKENESKTGLKVIRVEYINQTVQELITLMQGDIVHGSPV